MKPVDQKVIDPGYGDCMRAALASLLEYDIEHVPNFILLPRSIWKEVFYIWLTCQGWKFTGKGYLSKNKINKNDSFNGYFLAVVPSKTYDGKVDHAVVINKSGIVIHDPNPNKLYQNENIIQSNSLKYWYMVEPLVKL